MLLTKNYNKEGPDQKLNIPLFSFSSVIHSHAIKFYINFCTFRTYMHAGSLKALEASQEPSTRHSHGRCVPAPHRAWGEKASALRHSSSDIHAHGLERGECPIWEKKQISFDLVDASSNLGK